jgi:hypothetical protein
VETEFARVRRPSPVAAVQSKAVRRALC